MEYRSLGKNGPKVSLLGFGCGAIGGLLVKGDPSEQRRTVARALEAGITYFDTAPAYAAWTPTLTASSSNPTASATSGENRYIQSAKKVDGVTEVVVSHKTGRANVTYDPAKSTPSAVAKAITDGSGFKADVDSRKDQ